MPAASILDALDHAGLFRDHFRGETWAAWRAFLASLFGLEMTPEQLALFQHHTGRSTPPTVPFAEAALICGRRAGKSRVLALIAVYLACFRDYAQHLAAGEIATIAVIAADRRQARTIMRYMVGLLTSVPVLRGMVQDETAESVVLRNRVTIEITTASFRVTRGYTLAAALCDELAFFRTEDSANPDEEILAALRPGLSSLPGSMLLLASSPYAKRGALFKTFRRHYGHDDARVLVWKASTAEMNPGIDPAIIAEAFEDDPASAAAEYGAQFRDDIAAFVTREVIEACTTLGRYELPPISTSRYSAFVDPSGGSADSMTLAIAHRDGAVAVLDALREVRPPFSPEAVVQDFAALLKTYRISRVRGDRYAGEWPREQFRKAGITYDLSDQPTSDIYRDLLPKLNSQQIELLDLPRLVKQFCDLERRTSRSGKDQIGHPPAGHDDVANAVAGALLLAGGRQPMRINPEVLAALSVPMPGTDGWRRQRGYY